MTYELACTTNMLLREIADKAMKRLDVAKTYALALRSSWPTDWLKVNKAILARWSPHALVWIKEKAWSGKAFAEATA